MKISLLVPCFNEEKSLEASIKSCLNQTRKFDELIFIDDFSSDKTPEILASFGDRIKAYRVPKNTGNKSGAQEFGFQFITGDVVVTTDADTLLKSNFVEEIENDFQNPNVAAVAGTVKSMPYNWITLCRAFEYTIGQYIHKLAQSYMNYIFVMPGAASAFRVDMFRKYITFDHDTITEDLDFTYKLHLKQFKIVYNRQAITYTQDPTNLSDYINQMRRWFGGGWQNVVKHHSIITTKPIRAFELSILYSEGLIFSILIFLIPLINLWFALLVIIGFFQITLIFAIWAAIKEKRWKLLFVPFPYMILMYVNAYIYLEQFVKEVVFRRKNLVWFKPGRVFINKIT